MALDSLSQIKSYGFKEIDIRIGRKNYRFKAIKSEVDSPVLGWDFVRRHRLELVWNNFGDSCIRDKVADTTTVLPFKPVPIERSVRHKNLCLVEVQSKPNVKYKSSSSQDNLVLIEQIAAVEALEHPEKKEERKIDPKYQKLLDKFPDILKVNFNDNSSKNGVIHRINIKKDAKPCKAKLRRFYLLGPPLCLNYATFLGCEKIL